MSKSTKSRRSGKVTKPHPDFPLFPHASGRWAKKVQQRFHYFGKTSDDPKGEAALLLWLEQKDDLLAGRKPRTTAGTTLADMVNVYLASADDRRESGALAAVTLADYKATAVAILSHFGRTLDPSQIRPAEFAAFRNRLAGKYAPTRAGKMVTQTRMMFRWAWESEVITSMPNFGPGFRGATKRASRLAKAASGGKAYSVDELRTLLDAAPEPLDAMILLGVNGGFGNSDNAKLPLAAVDLDGGWIDYPRPKTGIPRRVPLWPETVAALRTVIENRPTPESDDVADRVFLTTRGREWIVIRDDGRRYDGITIRFGKLTRDTETHQQGRSFYGLRHTTETIGGGARDQVALDTIMGHVDNSMAANYRHGIDDDRLQAVAEHVRRWLFADIDVEDEAESRDAETPEGGPTLRIVG